MSVPVQETAVINQRQIMMKILETESGARVAASFEYIATHAPDDDDDEREAADAVAGYESTRISEGSTSA